MSLADSISGCALYSQKVVPIQYDALGPTFARGGSSSSKIGTRDTDASPAIQKRRLKGSKHPPPEMQLGLSGKTMVSLESSGKTNVTRKPFDCSPAVTQVWPTFTPLNVMSSPNVSTEASTPASKLSALDSRPKFDCSPSAGLQVIPRPPRVSLPPEAKGVARNGASNRNCGKMVFSDKPQVEELSKIMAASQSVQECLGDLCSTLQSDWGSQARKKRHAQQPSKESLARSSKDSCAMLAKNLEAKRSSVLKRNSYHSMFGRNVAYEGSDAIKDIVLTEDHIHRMMQQPPLTAIRQCLVLLAGNWQEAFKMLDSNGNGDVSMLEFEAGLHTLGVPYEQLTGYRHVRDLWKLFDVDHSGVLDIQELLGVSLEDVESHAWRMQNTREKWFNWCERTHRKANLGRNPCWAVDKNKQIEDWQEQEAQHAYEKIRMKSMMQKGIHHKNRSAVASFLPKVLNEETVSRQRREDLDKVFGRSKKIKGVLNDVSFRRKELTSYVQTIKELTNQSETVKKREAKKTENKDSMLAAASMLGQSWGKPQNMANLVHFFDEDQMDLDESEVHLRQVARSLGIPIPDAESIKRCFDSVDTDKSGEIEKPEFRVMINQMLGNGTDRISDARISEYWLTLDHDGSGTVAFEEFLQWYYEQFGAPSLSTRKAQLLPQM